MNAEQSERMKKIHRHTHNKTSQCLGNRPAGRPPAWLQPGHKTINKKMTRAGKAKGQANKQADEQAGKASRQARRPTSRPAIKPAGKPASKPAGEQGSEQLPRPISS